MNRAAVMTMARFYARKEVEANWRSEGRRLRELEPKELHRLAHAYLASHPEIVEKAAEVIRTCSSNLVTEMRPRAT